jgi:hypothetical protein
MSYELKHLGRWDTKARVLGDFFGTEFSAQQFARQHAREKITWHPKTTRLYGRAGDNHYWIEEVE